MTSTSTTRTTNTASTAAAANPLPQGRSTTPAGGAPGAVIMAGIPATNFSLFHRVRFRVGDPAVILELPRGAGASAAGAQGAGATERLFIVRDIELERAKRQAKADSCHSMRDFEPSGGFSGDRETATAQAAAECLRRRGISRVRADRSLPLLYAHVLAQAGITVECDPELGVADRRRKDAQEIVWLDEAQRITEDFMERACTLIARAEARRDGVLLHEGAPLTSERMFTMIDGWCLEKGCENPGAIIACGPVGGDCHDRGRGELRTGQPIIVDIFPRVKASGYFGDCTRGVVHGDIPDAVVRMHQAVLEAKAAAQKTIRAGVTADAVHAATLAALSARGFPYRAGGPPEGDLQWCGIVHGTGHGVGLECHEPPLLDKGGPVLLEGDVVTVEPGVYSRGIGGVRIEDLVVVEKNGARQLGRGLATDLRWG
ncbi:MAG: aminopeptidase P family protein [Phycisphaerae bacterium]|nr:aminopeptidase P family protein [Phycisphaerae bacterium]